MLLWFILSFTVYIYIYIWNVTLIYPEIMVEFEFNCSYWIVSPWSGVLTFLLPNIKYIFIQICVLIGREMNIGMSRVYTLIRSQQYPLTASSTGLFGSSSSLLLGSARAATCAWHCLHLCLYDIFVLWWWFTVVSGKN